jgi:hypothetical protein
LRNYEFSLKSVFCKTRKLFLFGRYSDNLDNPSIWRPARPKESRFKKRHGGAKFGQNGRDFWLFIAMRA